MQIETIDHNSPHFAAVIKLASQNKATLGFLPDEAFRSQRLLVAIQDGCCIGYLLWRRSKDKATITHLCVADASRGNGCAAALVNQLIEETKQLRSIDLRCRRDYEANNLWRKLGFVAHSEITGRSLQGHLLTCWRIDHGHPDLFTREVEATRLTVVLDANVYLDVADPANPRNDESPGLLADWLQPLLRLCVTEELFNDLDRSEDVETRRRHKSKALAFDIVRSTPAARLHAEQMLRPLFGDIHSVQDQSDFRQLARTHAAGISVFVTRDEKLLNKADGIYDACGLSVERPSDLIGRIDELTHEQEYQRAQIAGTNKIFRKRVSACSDALLEPLLSAAEKKATMRDLISSCIAKPRQYACYSVEDRDQSILAVYIVESKENLTSVPLLRLCDQRLAGTLARSILTQLTYEASRLGRCVLIADPRLSADAQAACDDLGFLSLESGRLKVVLEGVRPARELAIALETATKQMHSSALDNLSALLKSPDVCTDPGLASQAEHFLWPAKIADGGIPAFIVPIRADFALHLFDEQLARQDLFGADLELALNPESVYYRAPRPGILSCPGRILWYVSERAKFEGTMRIRACSRIEEVAIGKPKELFRRFRRLGVYDWADVYATAKQNVDKDIMAIRFHDTELLPNPLRREVFEPVLRSHNATTNLQSPRSIPPAAFNELYAIATAKNPAAVDQAAVR